MADKRIKELPVLHSYLMDEEQRMFPLGGVTPVGKLQQLQWLSIAEFINIELPVSALPAKVPGKVPVQLVQSEITYEGYALMTNLATWKAYAETAPSIRLEHLQFAAAANGNVLIAGTPLPPIQGKEFYKEENILLPAGYAFEVSLVDSILQEKLNAENDALLVFTSSGEWHRLPLSSFVQATRSAVRLTVLTKGE